MKTAGLVLDIGNTSYRMALYADGNIFEREDAPNAMIPMICQPWLRYSKTTIVNCIAVASVASWETTNFINEALRQSFPSAPLRMISGDMENLPLQLAHDLTQKEKIGADRLANAMGAVALKKHPCVIADFGTALTVDGVNEKGEFVGGMILPGMQTLLTAMHQNTARLPDIAVPKEPVAYPFGKNTWSAMLAGAEHGYRGLVRETVTTMRAALRENGHSCPFEGRANRTDRNVRSPLLLATGGMASRIAPASGLEFEILPDLTLLGIAQVLQGVPS